MRSRLKTFKWQKWVVLGRNFFEPPFKISDQLINEARIVHVVHGHSELYSASKHLPLRNGDTVVMKADNFINNWKKNEGQELNEVIVFQLTAGLLRFVYNNEMPAWFRTKENKQISPVTKVEKSTLLDNFWMNLRFYMDNSKFISEELLKLKIKELIFILLETDKSGSITKTFHELFNANEYSFQEVIQKNLFEELNLNDLAFLTGLSLSSFKRKFSNIYGTSPNKYINSKRLEKAQLLLSSTNQRISEIAYACGFNEIGYFSKLFKGNYGLTPSEYRKSI